MDRMRKREFPMYFAKGKSLFHVVARISDEQGSLSKVLETLGPRVNFIGTNTYTLEDGTAVFSGYAEATKPGESAEKLKGLIASSNAVKEAAVMPGQDGILVDTFHTGFEALGEESMLFRRKAIAGMLAHVYRLFGSGGEALLYEEGKAIGRSNMEEAMELMGKDRVRNNMAYIRKRLYALGWGDVTVKTEGEVSRFEIRDCFECSHDEGSRTGCHFFRGYIVGNRGALHGREPESEEVKCVLRGDRHCEFVISPRA